MTPDPDPAAADPADPADSAAADGDLRALFARTAPPPTPTDLAPLRAALRGRPSPPSSPVPHGSPR